MKTIELTSENRQALEALLKERSNGAHSEEERAVSEILEQVKERGDEALFSYTERFDGIQIDADSVEVREEEIEEAYQIIDSKLLDVIRRAKERIADFHEKQKRQSWFSMDEDGSMLGQKMQPMERAGVYVPGGRAVYPSSVLMNIVPAKVAGVDEIIMTTPAGRDGKIRPAVLAAAKEAGADRIFKVGGAQAVAAMAYGTASIPRVDIIVGPGNIYVALAKKAVYGEVAIDSVAGPSEILVLADETADARYVASDLLSQAEHDPMASAILITTARELSESVMLEIERLKADLPRREIIEASLDQYGQILIAERMEDAIEAANAIASEHLEILTKDPLSVMGQIRNAGAVFLGPYSSEPLGDYMAGPNHILPTGGTARFFSALSVDHFIKKISVIRFSKEGLSKLHEDIEYFARAEGLDAHAQSIATRFEDGKDRL